MEKFKEIKAEILRRGYEAKACEEIERAEESDSMEELARVIKRNFNWCVYRNVIDTEIICKYRVEFASVDIYANESRSNGYVVVDADINHLNGNAIAILYGNANVKEVCGNAILDRVFGKAVVNEVYGNAIVKDVCGNATVNHVHGNATVNEIYGNATINRVCSNANVGEVFGNATIHEAYGNVTINRVCNKASVNECNNVTIHEVYDDAYISVYRYIKCKINGNAIMRVRSENKIYTNTEVEIPNNN